MEYNEKLVYRAERRGVRFPKEAGSAIYTPKMFAAWLEKRRNAKRALRGDFPRSGCGWVYVSAK